MADTQWQSMFDAGPCTVSVYRKSLSTTWSDVLGKGSTSPWIDNDGRSDQFHVDVRVVVSQDGVISVETKLEQAFNMYSEPPEIIVTPNYSVGNRKIAAAGVDAKFDDANGVSGVDVWFSDNQVFQLTQDAAPSDNHWLPDPAVCEADGEYVDVLVSVLWPS